MEATRNRSTLDTPRCIQAFAVAGGRGAAANRQPPCRTTGSPTGGEPGHAVDGHLATLTSKVTLFAPGPRLRTISLNFPSFAGVNLTSHFGPGLVSLPTSFLALS